MVKNIKTFKLENVKIVFENRSPTYRAFVDEQGLRIPSDWEYNKKVGEIYVTYRSVERGFVHFNKRFAVVIQRGWFRDKVILFSEVRRGGITKIASKPLPVVANVGYNSNTFYFGTFLLIIFSGLWLVWKKFYKHRK